jgi:superfamily I DNA and/or RNA helicase
LYNKIILNLTSGCPIPGEARQDRLRIAKRIKEYYTLLEQLKTRKSLFELVREIKVIEKNIADNSLDLWENWLRLLPDRLTTGDRKIISDYTTLLKLIVRANENKISRNIWAKYYQLLPKVANILPCWSVTSLSVRGKVPFEKGFFDLVVIDEASQCDIASALPLLFRAKRAVIIGDSKQLSHICSINEQQDIKLLEKYDLTSDFISWSYVSQSLFDLGQSICKTGDIVKLKDHHRSHAEIIHFSNREFYDGDLRIATKYENLKSIPNEPAVRWVDVKGSVDSPRTGGSYNLYEANGVVKELKRLVNINYNGTIGVVTPFRLQANRIRDVINRDNELIERLNRCNFLVNTVHTFQGDERDIMIFSPVIAPGMKKGSLFFLKRTGNLFNVAVTRARAVLIVVGDKSSCMSCEVEYMKRFVDYVNQIGSVKAESKRQIYDFGEQYPETNSKHAVSEWEKNLYEALYREGIKTIPQYPVEQYLLDLALINDSRMLDIEVDGEHYHRNWDGELHRRDQLRNKRLIELGWDVLRFWVYEIRDNIDGCIARVKKWIEK